MNFAGKYDRIFTGVISAGLLPMITLLIFWLFSSGYTLISYISRIIEAGIVTHIISLCVFTNVIIFMIFNRLDMLKASRGVLGMTIFWACVVFLIKIL